MSVIKFAKVPFFCLILTIFIIVWGSFYDNYLELLLLKYFDWFVGSAFPSLFLTLSKSIQMPGSYDLISGLFKPQLEYVSGEHYPNLQITGVTKMAIQNFRGYANGISCYFGLLLLIILNTSIKIKLRTIAGHIAFLLVTLFISIHFLMLYKVSLLSPETSKLLSVSANQLVVTPIKFHPIFTYFSKLITDFSGVIATFALPGFLCFRLLCSKDS